MSMFLAPQMDYRFLSAPMEYSAILPQVLDWIENLICPNKAPDQLGLKTKEIVVSSYRFN